MLKLCLGDIDSAGKQSQVSTTLEHSSSDNSSSHTPRLPKICLAFSRYKKYLHSYYNRNPILRDDKLSIAPSSEFINLALVKKDEQISSFTISTLHGGVDEIRKSKIPVGMDAIVASNSKFVLVEGPPGIGKSTLCWELCRQWDTLKSLQDYKIVLQLKLREKRVQDASSLQEIFYHRDKELSQNVVKEVLSSEGEGVLLIFDGFDEMPTSVVQDKDSLLMELISGTSLPRSTCLVTSRPSALHHKEICFPQECRHIEILGFTSDESKTGYAELAFKSEPEVFASFKNFIFSNPIIKSLMYIPVNCAIISQVYKDIRKSRKLMPKTMTQLYSTLIPVLIKRYMIEKGEWNSKHGIPSNLNDLPNEFVFALNRVCELAYNGLFKESIQLVFTDSDVGEGFQHLGLLSETKEMYVCEGAVSSYSFLHLSIQEFLAAWHVKCHPELINERFIGIVKEFTATFNRPYRIGKPIKNDSDSHTMCIKPQFTTFGYFIAGMIGCDVLKFNHSCDLPFQIMCIYEAQDCSHLYDQYQYTLNISSNPLEIYALGYLLVNAPIQWYLILNTRYLPPLMETLESSLSNHACSLNQIQGSIVGLEILAFNDGVDPKLLLLPKCILHTIIQFRIEGSFIASVLCQLLPHLINIKYITINFSSINPDDYLNFQAMRQIQINTFWLNFTGITLKGIQELFTTLSSSSTIIETVGIYCNYGDDCDPGYGSWHKAALDLSCSSVKTISTNIPFHILPTNHHVETIIYLGYCISTARARAQLLDCLLCFAEMCKVQSMNRLEIRSFAAIDCWDYRNFLSVLNNSLHQNPFMCRLRIDTDIFFKFEELPHISKAHVNVRRTKSLSDIATAVRSNSEPGWPRRQRSPMCKSLKQLWQQPIERHIPGNNDDFQLQRSKSCSNLLSLHHIHPLLYKALIHLNDRSQEPMKLCP